MGRLGITTPEPFLPLKTICSWIRPCEEETRPTIEPPLQFLDLKLSRNLKCVAFPPWTICQICIFFISFPCHFWFSAVFGRRRCVYFIGFHYSRNNSPPTFKKGEGKYRSILYQKPIKLLLGSDTPTVLSNIKSLLICSPDNVLIDDGSLFRCQQIKF